MSWIYWLFLGCLSFSASATTAAPSGFAQTLWGSLQFRNVEMISRVHEIGLHREAQLSLRPWAEVSQNAFLGIDSNGRLVQVVRAEERLMAFLLSGDRRIKDFFYHQDGHLFAIDDQGRLMVFDWAHWSKPVVPGILQRSISRYFLSLGVVGLALANYAGFTHTPISSFEIMGSYAIAASSGAFIEGFRSSMEFDSANESTDGLQLLGAEIEGYRDHQFARGPRGQIADYQLLGREGSYSLNQLVESASLKTASQNMDLKCEHFLLPRGIPAREYEPQF